ncbi:MAG: methylglyoxal synthase [Tissierellia bacterium]|nr:methylglyoxal synthase [Tissierellia bacterium]
MQKYKQLKINKKKNIAIVAHDGKKEELFYWIGENLDKIKKHNLVGTGTTASVLKEKYNLNIKPFLSGPIGGDQMIGAEIAKNNIDILIFFWDPLTAQPHDPDVKALLRIAVLYDVVVAMSPSSANFVFNSHLIDEEYEKSTIDINDNLSSRIKKFK